MTNLAPTGKFFNRNILLSNAGIYVNGVEVITPTGTVVTGTPLTVTTLTATGAVTLESTLTGGSSSNIAINTNKFTVAASSGNTVIAGTLGVTGAVTHTSTTLLSDDVTIASGKSIIGAGTGSNGIVLKNLKNQVTGTLSGTQKAIVIDIGGTPYYFLVSPTIT